MKKLLIEGKTKAVTIPDDVVRLGSKNDITAGDGKKHDLLDGKAELSTRTTSNVFKLLQACGLPVAFYAKDSPTTFLAPRVHMMLWEVVVRGEGHGSWLKRNPPATKGTQFDKPIVELFLKTTGKVWRDYELPCDDPYAIIDADKSVRLYRPDVPTNAASFIGTLTPWEAFTFPGEPGYVEEAKALAIRAFLILHRAWQELGKKLVDIKIEFGVDIYGTLFIADVIDNDSHRLLEDGEYVDKQPYRDGAALDLVLENYRKVAALTDRFPEITETVSRWVRANL